MKLFSRSKKGKEHSSHHDASPLTTIAERPGGSSLSQRELSPATSTNISQPGQSVQFPPNTLDRVKESGLFLLNPQFSNPNGVKVKETHSLDIVALHGINGDAYKTWTHENGKFWLQDFLPKEFPGARVFSFGYPAKVVLSLGTENLESYARSLLEHLKRERQTEVSDPFILDAPNT